MPDEAANAAADASATTVNAQVVDTLRVLNEAVLGSDNTAAGGAIAYQHVAHAVALAIQDAIYYQRNALTISTAAQGKAFAMMLEDPARVEQFAIVHALAVSSAVTASMTATEISKQASAILQNFPRG